MTDIRENVKDKLDICNMVMNSGIVGVGGAGFPTHVKLSSTAEIVIANGAECEPILETDRHLMLREAGKVLEGLKLAMRSVKAEKGIIAIKKKHEDIAYIFSGMLKEEKSIMLHLLDNFYPAGDEHVLVFETTSRVVPMGGIPIDVNVVVNNVHTLASVADSYKGIPFTHKYVTITGEVRRPCVVKLPIGISIKEAIEKAAGGIQIKNYKVIVGGPMMGRVEENLDSPIIKTTGAIIVLPQDHKIVEIKNADLKSAMKKAKSVCCQCSQCTDMCPRFLLGHNLKPHKMMRLLSGFEDRSELEGIYSSSLCSECGLCGYYTCTMGLMPNAVNRYFKGVLSKNKVRPDYKRTIMEEVHTFREYRKVPTNRLIDKLGLTKYNFHLPFVEFDVKPEKLVLPLKQHIGAPSIPVVTQGRRVYAGELIAEIPDKNLGANLHSPVDGVVKEISDDVVIESI